MHDPVRRGLGRGLEVLMGGAGTAELIHLPVEAVHANPRQPRKSFDAAAAASLAGSLRHQGVLQPVIVRPRSEGGYELIAGERRWRAAVEAGLPTIPAVVREADDRDALVLGLVENVVRESLSPVEEARAYALLLDEFQLSLGDVAERVNRSKASVSNRVRLLELPEDVLDLVTEGVLSEGHARAVLSLPSDEDRRALARRVRREGLSVRQAERIAQDGGARRRRRGTPVDPALARRARESMERLTGLPARVAGGKLELHFGDETRLAELVEALERLAAEADPKDSLDSAPAGD